MHGSAPAADGVPSDVDGFYAWLRLGISVVLATISGVGMWSVVVVLPSVQAEFGIDRAAASLPYTGTMLGFALGNAITGRFVDRWGYWVPSLLSAALLGAGFLLASLSPSVMLFTAIQTFMIGAGAAACFGPLIADISHWFERRRGIAVSICASGNYLAGAIWPVIMPRLMEAGGWRFTYQVIGIVCVATMIPLILLLKRGAPRRAVGSYRRPIKTITLSPGALQALLILAGLSCCVAMSMPQVHIVAYCMDLGYGVARGAEMLSIMLGAGVVSRLVSGLLADRIGGIRTLLIGSAAQGLSLLFYIPFDGLASLYVVSLVFGLSQGGIVPSYAVIVRDYMPAAEAGARVGLVVMSTTVGMALGGWMSGWIYELTGSYTAAFLNGVGWNVLNASVILLLLFKSNRMSPAQA